MRVIEIITGYVIFTPAYTYLQIPTENHHEPVSQFKIKILWQRRTERFFNLVFSLYALSFYRSQNALGGFFFFVQDKKLFTTLCLSQTFCAGPKDNFCLK